MDVAAEVAGLQSPQKALAPFSGAELRVLSEIVRDAYRQLPGGSGSRGGATGSPLREELSLLTVLQSYQSVLHRHGIDTSKDTFYYKTILELSLRGEEDWWRRLEAETSARRGPVSPPTPPHRGVALSRGSRASVDLGRGRSSTPLELAHLSTSTTSAAAPLTKMPVAAAAEVVEASVVEEPERVSRWGGESADDVTEFSPTRHHPRDERRSMTSSRPSVRERVDLSDARNYPLIRLASRVFRGWVSATIESKAVSTLAVGRIQHMILASAAASDARLSRSVFDAWSQYTLERVALRKRMTHALIHWRNRELSKCWVAWRSHVDESLRMPIRSWTHVGALFHWVAVALPDQGDDSVRRFGNALLEDVVEWTSSSPGEIARARSERNRDIERRIGRSRSYVLRRIRPPTAKFPLLQQATAIWDAQILVSVWSAWRTDTRRHVTARKLGRRAVFRRCVHHWRSWCDVSRAIKERFQEAIGHADSVLKTRYMAKWKRVAEIGRIDRELVAALNKKIALRALAAWRRAARLRWAAHVTVGRLIGLRFFMHWKKVAHEGRLTRRAMSWWKMGSVRRTFEGWRSFTEDRHSESRELTAQVEQTVRRAVVLAWRRSLEKQRLAKRCLFRLRFRTAAKVFAAWRRETKEQMALKSLAERQQRRRELWIALRALRVWRRALKARRLMRRILARLVLHKASLAMRQWVGVTRHARHREQVASNALSRIVHRRLSSAWLWFVECVEDQRARRRLMERAVTQLTMRKTALAFRTWWERVDTARSYKAAMYRAVTVWRDASTARAMRHWLDVTRSARRSRELARRFFAVWHNAATMACFRSWVAFTREEAERRGLLERCVLQIKHARLGKAIRQWRFISSAQRERKMLLRRALAKLHMKTVSRVFTAWAEDARSDRSIRERTSLLLVRLSNAKAYNALVRWRQVTERRMDARLLLVRGAGVFRFGKLSQAFRTWREQASSSSRLRQSARRVVQRWRQARVGRAFETWYEWKVGRSHRRESTLRVIQRFRSSRLLWGFVQWREALDRKKEALRRMERIVRRLRLVKAGYAITQWRGRCDERAETRERLRAVLSRLQHARSGRAFRKWLQLIEDKHSMRERLERVVRTLLMSRAARVLRTWRDNVRNADDRRARLSLVVKRLRHARVGRSFRSWQDTVRRRSDAKEHMRGIIARILLFRAHQALATWHDHAQASADRRHRMRLVVVRLQQGKLTKGFLLWRAKASNAVHNRAMMRIAVARFQMSIVGRCFDTWKDNASEQHHQKLMVGRAAAFLFNRTLASSFATWKANFLEMRAARETTAVAVHRMLNWRAVQGLRSWREWTAERSHVKRVARTVATRWRHSNAVRALRSWHDAASASGHRKRTMRRAIVRFQRSHAVRALEVWREKAAESCRRRSLMHKCITRTRMQQQARAIATWVTFTQEASHRRSVMDVCARRCRWAGLGRGFRQWRSWNRERRASRSQARRALSWWTHASQRKAFLVLREEMEQGRLLRARLASALLRLQHSSSARAFATWREYIQETRRHREIVLRVTSRWQMRSLHSSFDAWRHFRELRSRARVVLKRIRQAREFAAWSQWCAVVRDARRSEAEAAARVRKALLFWQNGTHARVFQAWKRHFQLQKRLLDTGTLVSGLSKKRLVSRALILWRLGFVVSRRGRTSQVRAALRRWRSTTKEERELHWHVEAFDDRAQARGTFHVVKAAGIRWMKLPMSKAFGTLKLHAHLRRLRKLHMMLAATYNNRALVGKCFERLKKYYYHRLDKHAVADWHLARFMRAHLRGWHAVAAFERSQALRIESLLPIADTHYFQGVGRKSFQAWAGHAFLIRRRRLEILDMIRNRSAVTMRSTFHHWHSITAQEKRLKGVVEHMFFQSQRVACAVSLRRWHQVAHSTAQRRLNTAWFYRKSSLSRALRLWQVKVRLAKWKQHQHSKALDLRRMFASRSVESIFHSWKHRAAQARLIRKFVVALECSSVSAVFHAWVDMHRREKFHASVAVAHVAKLLFGQQRRCFMALKDYAADSKRIKLAMGHVVSRWRNRQLTRSINTWASNARERRHAKRAAGHALRRMMHYRTSLAFSSWKSWTTSRNHRRQASLVVIARLRKSGLHSALLQWRDTVEGLRRSRKRLSRAINRLRMQKAVKCLRHWHEIASERTRLRGSARRVVLLLTHRKTAQAVATWRSNVDDALAARETMRRAVARLIQSGAVRALRHWRELTERHMAHRETLARAIVRMRRQNVAKTLTRWIEWSRNRRAHREVLRHAALKWRMALLGRAFLSMKQGILWEKRMRIVESMERVHDSRLLRTFFYEWVDSHRRRARAVDLCTKFFHRFEHRELSMAFRAWHVNTRAEAGMVRLFRALAANSYRGAMDKWKHYTELMIFREKVAKRWRQMDLWRGFSQWHAWKQSVKYSRLRALLVRNASRRAMARWCERVAERQRLRRSSLRVAQRMRYGAMAHSFQKWLAHSRLMNTVRSLFDRSNLTDVKRRFALWKIFAVRERRLREASEKVLHAVGAGSRRDVIAAWRQALAAKLQAKMSLKRRAFASLKAVLVQARTDLTRAEIGHARILHGLFHRSFLRWAFYSKEARKYRADLKRQQIIRLHIARKTERANTLLLQRTFVDWHIKAVIAQRCKAISRRFTMRGIVNRCFQVWKLEFSAKQRERQVAQRAAASALVSLSRRTFLRWKRFSRAAALVRRSQAWHAHTLARRAFAHWSQAAKAARLARAAIMPHVAALSERQRLRVARETFGRWKTEVIARKRSRVAFQRHSLTLLRRWKRIARRSAIERTNASRALRFYRQRLLVTSFAQWSSTIYRFPSAIPDQLAREPSDRSSTSSRHSITRSVPDVLLEPRPYFATRADDVLMSQPPSADVSPQSWERRSAHSLRLGPRSVFPASSASSSIAELEDAIGLTRQEPARVSPPNPRVDPHPRAAAPDYDGLGRSLRMNLSGLSNPQGYRASYVASIQHAPLAVGSRVASRAPSPTEHDPSSVPADRGSILQVRDLTSLPRSSGATTRSLATRVQDMVRWS
jgi:hypothetical protein